MDTHTLVEGFRMTFGGKALLWLQMLQPFDYQCLKEFEKELIASFSKVEKKNGFLLLHEFKHNSTKSIQDYAL